MTTDPMTPVRALIEAAGKATPGEWILDFNSKAGTVTVRGPRKDGDVRDYDKTGTLVVFDVAVDKLADLMFPRVNEEDVFNANFMEKARNATASISQLLSEHDKVVELVEKMAAESADVRSRWASVGRELTEHDDGFYGAVDEFVRKYRAIVEGK